MKSASLPPSSNVAPIERAASLAAGALLIGRAFSRRNGLLPLLLLAGGALLLRGGTGYCALYRRLGIDTSRLQGFGVRGRRGIRVEKSVEVGRAPAQVFSYWRQLENLPRFMPHLKAVHRRDDGRSRWEVEGPAGRTVAWEAEIINERPGELLAWQSLPGSDVENAGTVRFDALGGGRATRVTVVLSYHPPAGEVGAAVAGLFGDSPERQLEEDLVRFRDLIESDTDTAA